MRSNAGTSAQLQVSNEVMQTSGVIALTTAAQTIVAANASYGVTVRGLRIGNLTGGAITVTAHLVPSGGSAATATQLSAAKSYAANTWTAELANGEVLYIPAGYALQMLASAASDSIHVLATYSYED